MTTSPSLPSLTSAGLCGPLCSTTCHRKQQIWAIRNRRNRLDTRLDTSGHVWTRLDMCPDHFVGWALEPRFVFSHVNSRTLSNPMIRYSHILSLFLIRTLSNVTTSHKLTGLVGGDHKRLLTLLAANCTRTAAGGADTAAGCDEQLQLIDSTDNSDESAAGAGVTKDAHAQNVRVRAKPPRGPFLWDVHPLSHLIRTSLELL